MYLDKELGDKTLPLSRVRFGLVNFVAPQTNALLFCDNSASQLSCRVFSMDEVAAKGIVLAHTSVINLAFFVTNWNFVDLQALLKPSCSHRCTFKSGEHRQEVKSVGELVKCGLFS